MIHSDGLSSEVDGGGIYWDGEQVWKEHKVHISPLDVTYKMSSNNAVE